jgi:hypothetical protein
MSVDERRMRQVLVPWPVSPFETAFKPPLQIGSFALLAHPGTILETESEDDATRMTKTRFLIKLTDNGTIFNLVCTLNGDELSWTWKSQEFHSGMVSGETLEMLKQAVTHLVETEIPHVLAKVSPIPT